MKTEKRGGYNKKPVVWKGKRYNSITELTDSLGLTKGYLSYYLKNDVKFKGDYVDYAL